MRVLILKSHCAPLKLSITIYTVGIDYTQHTTHTHTAPLKLSITITLWVSTTHNTHTHTHTHRAATITFHSAHTPPCTQ